MHESGAAVEEASARLGGVIKVWGEGGGAGESRLELGEGPWIWLASTGELPVTIRSWLVGGECLGLSVEDRGPRFGSTVEGGFEGGGERDKSIKGSGREFRGTDASISLAGGVQGIRFTSSSVSDSFDPVRPGALEG